MTNDPNLDPNLDDDTSTARVTQGGRRRRGSSLWRIILAVILAVGLLVFVIYLHRVAPAEPGGAPHATAPAPTAVSGGVKP